MTRKEVARRLGKSVATVRHIEGALLHPSRDARGVHQFDEDEVEALAADVARGAVSLAPDLGGHGLGAAEPPSECTSCAVHMRDVAALRAKLDEQQSAHSRALNAVRAQHARELAAYDRAAHELVAQVEELAEELI
jgi:hypothetical protein